MRMLEPLDHGWLRDQYIGRECTIEQIAECVGCSASKVYKALQDAGVPLRRRGQRRRHGHTVGGAASRTYSSWRSMHYRCSPVFRDRVDYLDRGVVVCERWSSFDAFLADMGERPEGKTLDRIDNAGIYEPGNCRWATPSEQNYNQRPRLSYSDLPHLLARCCF